MQDYIRKLIVRQWCTEGLRAMFAIERRYEHDSDIAKARKKEALNTIKDKLESALVHGQVTAFEFYIIIGYLDEYAFGNHFNDLPGV